jgi:diaminopimelate decarboxylase
VRPDPGVAAAAVEYGTPLTVVDPAALDERAAAFEDAARAAELEVTLYASYKTNPLPASLARLHARGWGAEVISPYELWLAERLEVPGARTILNGPSKSPSLITRALARGALVNANHLEEIDDLERAAATLGGPIGIGVRVSAPGGWGAQLGVRPDDAAEAFARVARSPHLELRALHVHRGREIRSLNDLDELLDAVVPLAESAGAPELDLGGSLGSRVRHLSLKDKRAAREGAPPPPSSDDALEPAAYIERIDRRLRALAPRLLLEPGRALFASSQLLVTEVLAVRRDHEPALAICDAGIHLAASVAHERHDVTCLTRDGDGHVWRLVGPICTPGDVLVQAWRGPDLQAGDLLAVHDTGAYILPFETTFAFPRPAVVWLDEDGARVVRRRESFEDLVARDVG